MSRYESMSGNGLLMKKDIKTLKALLIEKHNLQIERMKSKYDLKPNQIKKMGLTKATSRTNSFPLYYIYVDEEITTSKNVKPKMTYDAIIEGSISLNLETGEFNFGTSYNNHTVDDLFEHSLTFNSLLNFINKLEKKGTKYGATTYYRNENDEDEYGNNTEGARKYYGGWTPIVQRTTTRKKKIS